MVEKNKHESRLKIDILIGCYGLSTNFFALVFEMKFHNKIYIAANYRLKAIVTTTVEQQHSKQTKHKKNFQLQL